MKKVLAFDLDDTLNVTKRPISPETAGVLRGLLGRFEIAPISGAKYEVFYDQVVTPLKNAGATDDEFRHLHLFVTQGGRYYRFADGEWTMVYQYDLTDDQIKKITDSLETATKKVGLWEDHPVGEIIENRLSQVTFSALGQDVGNTDEGLKRKHEWDPDHKKREKIIAEAEKLAPEFAYEIGGSTSINVTKPGMNKTFGIKKLCEYLKVREDKILYFGDMTQPGGNDYPVIEMGVDTITVRDAVETTNILRGITYIAETK